MSGLGSPPGPRAHPRPALCQPVSVSVVKTKGDHRQLPRRTWHSECWVSMAAAKTFEGVLGGSEMDCHARAFPSLTPVLIQALLLAPYSDPRTAGRWRRERSVGHLVQQGCEPLQKAARHSPQEGFLESCLPDAPLSSTFLFPLSLWIPFPLSPA